MENMEQISMFSFEEGMKNMNLTKNEYKKNIESLKAKTDKACPESMMNMIEAYEAYITYLEDKLEISNNIMDEMEEEIDQLHKTKEMLLDAIPDSWTNMYQ
jgi:chromosome segregation ATPase